MEKNVSENEKSTIICHSHAESPEGMGYECSFIILNPYLHGQAWTLISHIIFACVGYPTGARSLVRIRLDVFFNDPWSCKARVKWVLTAAYR